MKSDLYDDGPEAPAQGMEQSGGEDMEQSGDHSGKTALLNSEICPGMEPGDMITLRITDVKDGEYVVTYSEEDKDKGKEDEAMPAEGKAMGGAEMGGGPMGYE